MDPLSALGLGTGPLWFDELTAGDPLSPRSDSTVERKTILLQSVEALLRVRAAFSAEDSTVPPRRVLEAAADVIEIFREGDIPANCRDLARAVEALEAEYRRHMEAYDDDADPMPGHSFWKAIEKVEGQGKAARSKQPVVLESIAELTEQKVSDVQIARMHGWVNEDGAPEVWKVKEERAKPGTHRGPDFVPPEQRKRIEEEREREAATARVRQRLAERIARITEPAPESIEQLLREGVSAGQIARMAKCTPEEVWAEAERLGVPRPPLDADPRATTGTHERPIAPETSRAMDAEQAMRAKIAANAKLKALQRPVGRPKGKKAKKPTKPHKAPQRAASEADDDLAATIRGLAGQGHDADGIMDLLGGDPAVTPELVESVLGEPAGA